MEGCQRAGPSAGRRPRLPLAVRQQVELDLRWFRSAQESLADAEREIGDLLQPQNAKWSHVGAQQGQPGDPTGERAAKVAAIRSRVRRDEFVARVLGKWLGGLPREHRTLLQMRYAVERDAPPATEEEIGAALHVSRGTVHRMTDDLLYRAAVRLLYWHSPASGGGLDLARRLRGGS